MCGRYVFNYTPEQLAEIKKIIKDVDDWINRFPDANFNLAPTDDIVTILGGKVRAATFSHFGLIPHWAKEKSIGNKLINARAETVHEKPSYRQPFKSQRCLIPANGFYEWQGKKPKTPYYIHKKGDAPFCFAGLWDLWHDPETQEPVYSSTIITTAPNELMKPIHDRMPVVLEPEQYQAWMSNETSPERLKEMLKGWEGDGWEVYEVSAKVNNPAYNNQECTKPVSLF